MTCLSTTGVMWWSWRLEEEGTPPSYRPPRQVWVLLEWESAVYTHYEIYPQYNSQFNYTMTYSRQSDIFYPYGECRPAVSNTLSVDDDVNTNLKGKNMMLLWMVSHCTAKNVRENYIRELGKYVPVDVLGKCGKNVICTKHNDCGVELFSSYKFYLAFENSCCTDFITEKLWRCFRMQVIPVVYGALDSYARYLPTNAASFPNPKALTEYIIQVDRNQALYHSYFEWHDKYICTKSTKDTKEVSQRVCKFFHVNQFKHHTVSVSAFWESERKSCIEPLS